MLDAARDAVLDAEGLTLAVALFDPSGGEHPVVVCEFDEDEPPFSELELARRLSDRGVPDAMVVSLDAVGAHPDCFDGMRAHVLVGDPARWEFVARQVRVLGPYERQARVEALRAVWDRLAR